MYYGEKKKKKFPGTRPISTTCILYRDQNIANRTGIFKGPFSRTSDVIVKNKILSYIGSVHYSNDINSFLRKFTPNFPRVLHLKILFPNDDVYAKLEELLILHQNYNMGLK